MGPSGEIDNSITHQPLPEHFFQNRLPYFNLKPHSYRATELNNWTIIHQHRWNSNFIQQRYRAQAEFVEAYTQLNSDGVPLISQRWEGTFAQCSLFYRLFQLLDECFFFGTLANPYDARLRPLVQLQISPALPADDENSDCWGYTECADFEDGDNCRKARIVIFGEELVKIDEFRAIRSSIALKTMIETLVHEMVHAYLDLFVCHCHRCEKNILNTMGISGHGSTFEELLASTVKDLKSWDQLFADFHATENKPGFLIDLVARSGEKKAREKKAETGRGLIPFAKPSGTRLIRIVKNGLDVLIRPPARTSKKQRRKVKAAREAKATIKAALEATARRIREKNRQKLAFWTKCQDRERDRDFPEEDNQMASSHPRPGPDLHCFSARLVPPCDFDADVERMMQSTYRMSLE